MNTEGEKKSLKIKLSNFKTLQAKTWLLFCDWLIQGDSQGPEHLQALLGLGFLLDRDIL